MILTIITVNLNNREGLEKTMNSVFGQTFKDFEYIIIDGGSTDGSEQVISQNQDRLAYWISETDSGIYQAMNKGIAIAKSEYLLFLNSGDFLVDPDTLGKVAPNLDSADIVFGDLRILHKGTYKDHSFPDKLTFSYFIQKSLGHPAAFIKRELFDQVGRYDESMAICADWGFFIRAVGLYNATYLHIPMIISVFNTDGVSSLPKNHEMMYQERINLLKNDFSFCESDYESYLDLKENLTALRRSKPYKILKFLGLPKYQS